jgi:transposase InsO family protein
MPWKETSVLECREGLVREVIAGMFTLSEAARRAGVSRPTAYKWVERYEERGRQGLCDASRAPLSCPHATAPEVAELVRHVRMAHPTWGPKKLHRWIYEHRPEARCPAMSTIAEIVRKAGLSEVRGHRRRSIVPYTRPLGHCDEPNRVWCADFKGWFRTRDGARCEPFTLSDGFSRYLLRCQALDRTTYACVRPVMESAFREYGLPAAIRTDNGPPFASRNVVGLSRLSFWWLQLGIVPERIEPGKPQQNGRHERMHLTLKRETAMPPALSVPAQQRRMDRFVAEYNHERPHEALGQTPPARHYSASPRPYPKRLAKPHYEPGAHLCRVFGNGCISWRGQFIFLTEILEGETLELRPEPSERYLAICYGPHRLAYLDTRHGKAVHRPRRQRDQTNFSSSVPGDGTRGARPTDGQSVNHAAGLGCKP